jgi:hypothetical protein
MRVEFVILTFIFGLGCGITNHALAAEEDDFFENGLRAKTEKTKERAFPGARDEQSLEVQTSLSQPLRTTDGVSLVAPVDDEDAPPPTAPTSD